MLVRLLAALPRRKSVERLRRLLRERSVVLSALGKDEDLRAALERRGQDLIVLEEPSLPREPEALRSFLQALRSAPDEPEVVVLAAQEDPGRRAALLSAGALAVLFEALPDASLSEALRAVVRRRRETAVQGLARDLPDARLADFASESKVMTGFLEIVRRVCASDSSLLIAGETGVGKERLARAIHNEGPRRAGPFLAVNCGALPETLLESELFGHEEGAFTGASRARRGRFELAHRGTIFLDEIGEMPPHLQVKLLRVLQEHEIQPLGSEESLRVDVRVMAATNRDLASDLRSGRFRPDLYYRLGVVTLHVPPLRERREDIEPLVRSYAEHFGTRLGRPVTGIEPEAMRALTSYAWPGNVRELINVLERAVLLLGGTTITLADLPADLSGAGRAAAGPEPSGERLRPAPGLSERPWAEVRDEALLALERAYFTSLLERCQGRIGEAARRAGLDPRSLYDKLRKLGLRKEGFRPSRVGP